MLYERALEHIKYFLHKFPFAAEVGGAAAVFAYSTQFREFARVNCLGNFIILTVIVVGFFKFALLIKIAPSAVKLVLIKRSENLFNYFQSGINLYLAKNTAPVNCIKKVANKK